MKNIIAALLFISPSLCQAFSLTIDSRDFIVTPEFNDVSLFNFNIEIEGELQAGTYDNPSIVSIEYSVSGILTQATPSQFEAFELVRSITGEEFYSQGSRLFFEIDSSANLVDGLQADELVGSTIIFTFDGREIDNGRFHPSLLELNLDGTGRLQNSNNTPSLSPLLEVDFGEEYITQLSFDPGNLTLVKSDNGGGGPAMYLVFVSTLMLAALAARSLHLPRC